MIRHDARFLIGVMFWSLAGLCFGVALLGFLIQEHRVGVVGMAGLSWFVYLACLPRRWFVKQDRVD